MASNAFATRLAQIEAGEASVKATAVMDGVPVEADSVAVFAAASCR